MLVNKDENILPKQIFSAHRTIHFSWLLKINLLPETIVTLAQLAFICSNTVN